MSRNLLSRVFPSSGANSEYEPVENDELLANAETDTTQLHNSLLEEERENEEDGALKKPFSWHDYTVFLFLGVSMLWAWYVCKRSKLQRDRVPHE